MSIEPKNLKTSLEENIRKLISQTEKLKNENERLLSDLNRREQELKLAHSREIELQSKYDSLKMAKILTVSEKDTEFSQQKLSKLVREINKCIALLNQQ